MFDNQTLYGALEQFRNQCEVDNRDPKRILSGFCGVAYDTSRKWKVDAMPVGLVRLKLTWLMIYSKILKAPANLNETLLYLSELVAFDILSPRDACELIELGGKDPLSQLYAMLRGERGPALAIVHGRITTEDLRDTYRDALKITQALLTPLAPPESTIPPDLSVAQQKTMPSNTGTVFTAEVNIYDIAAHVGALLPALRAIAGSTPEIRSAFRTSAGQGVVFEVSNLMNALCSERSAQRGV